MGDNFLILATWMGSAFLLGGFALILVRIIVGPTLPDRLLALDTLFTIGIGFIALIGVSTGYYLYLDVAIALALVGFLATVAFARFLLHRGEAPEPVTAARPPPEDSEIERTA